MTERNAASCPLIEEKDLWSSGGCGSQLYIPQGLNINWKVQPGGRCMFRCPPTEPPVCPPLREMQAGEARPFCSAQPFISSRHIAFGLFEPVNILGGIHTRSSPDQTYAASTISRSALRFAALPT